MRFLVLGAMYWAEVLGGARRVPTWLRRRPLFATLLGLWWVFLLLVTIAFVGRSTKFIYVDF